MFSHGNAPDGDPFGTKEKENDMSMDCDTRLSMMTLHDRTQRTAAPRRTSRRRSLGATTVAAMASFALTLFTRSV